MKLIKTVFFLLCFLIALLIFVEIKTEMFSRILPESKFRSQYILFKKDVKAIILEYKNNLSGQKDVEVNLKKEVVESPVIKKQMPQVLIAKDKTVLSLSQQEADYNDIGFTGYYAKADALALDGQYEESINYYNKAIAIEPDSEKCLYNRGTVYLNLKKYEQAIADYTLLINNKTDLIDVYFNRAMAFYYLDKYDEAMLDYNYVIKEDKSRYYAYLMRGNIYVAKGMYTAAVSDYSKAAVLDKNNAGIFYNRAVAYESLGHDNKAIFDYTKAIELDSTHQKAVIGRDRLYQKNGFSDKAQKDILTPRNLS